MRQRREIAGGTDGALRRDPRVDLCIHQRHQRLDDAQANARETARQAVDFEHHHQTDNLIVQRLTDARRVRQHQRTLQVFQIVRRDAGLRQQPKAGINPVSRAPFGNDGFNAGHAVVNGGVGAFIKRQGDRLTPDVTQLLERQ